MENIKRSVLITVYVGVKQEFCLSQCYPSQILDPQIVFSFIYCSAILPAFSQCSLCLRNILYMSNFCSRATGLIEKYMVGYLFVYIAFLSFLHSLKIRSYNFIPQVAIEARQKLFKEKMRLIFQFECQKQRKLEQHKKIVNSQAKLYCFIICRCEKRF